MTGSELLILLLVDVVCGAAAGVAMGRWTSGGFGSAGNAAIGAIGGLALTALAAYVPLLSRFVGGVETAAEAAMSGTGGITPALLIGVGIAGLLGGAALTVVVGRIFRHGEKSL